MPAKNSLKTYSEDSYYHLYNRGVEKRIIFQDQQDYNVFLSYLKTYLVPKEEMTLKNQLSDSTISWTDKDKALKLLRMNNFADEINLIAYCLMPNHFHLLLKQKSSNAIDGLMSSLGTRYAICILIKNIKELALYTKVSTKQFRLSLMSNFFTCRAIFTETRCPKKNYFLNHHRYQNIWEIKNLSGFILKLFYLISQKQTLSCPINHLLCKRKIYLLLKSS